MEEETSMDTSMKEEQDTPSSELRHAVEPSIPEPVEPPTTTAEEDETAPPSEGISPRS